MFSVFEFSHWAQLSGLSSYKYPNIRIEVTEYHSKQFLIGTKISIIDIENKDTYFEGFVRVVESQRFDPLAVFEVDDMIKRINSYGFNISIADSIKLPPNVITMLKGLQALGYNYITLEYIHDTKSSENKSLYQSNIDTPYTEYRDGQPPVIPPAVFSNKCVVATKHLGDVVNKRKLHDRQPMKSSIYIVSESPEFNWEDFKWLKPTKAYAISLLLTSDNVDL